MRHEVESDVQGNVWRVEASVGDRVKAGEVLVILESMKMEIPVVAPSDGVIAELRVQLQDQVQEGEVVIIIDDKA
ncbi:MAG: biotin/lipoyl-binding carrier protein [Pseudomonadales bacterium]